MKVYMIEEWNIGGECYNKGVFSKKVEAEYRCKVLALENKEFDNDYLITEWEVN